MLIARGVNVYVLAPKDEYSAKLTAEGVHFIPTNLRNYSTNPIHDALLAINLFRNYRRLKLDLIFHYTIKPNLYGTLAAVALKIPSIAVTTGLGRTFKFQSYFTRHLVLGLYRLAGRLCEEMWFLNDDDKKSFIGKRIVDPEKAYVLPSEGINLTKYREYENNRKTPITRFLYAGRLLKEKGVYEFVEAARILKAQHRKVRFELLGFIDENNSGSVRREEVLQWHNSGHIKYLGSTEDVRPFIARADCVVFPSFYREGISRTLLEAAAMCKPIITTRNVGCVQVVKDGYNGMLCTPKSVEDLVLAINKFLTFTKAERTAMGKNGRKLVKENFGEQRILSIYAKKIEEILRDRVRLNSSTQDYENDEHAIKESSK